MNYERVIEQVSECCRKVGRQPESVRVVAVSKNRSAEEVETLYQKGHRDFGENRAQELDGKAGALPADIRWHFIGPLQTNKVRLVRPIVHLLHSMDRPELGAAWMKGPGLPPPVLVQVNIGREPQKHGVLVEGLEDLASNLEHLGMDLRGLMAIPPRVESPGDARPYFAKLRGVWEQLGQLGYRMEILSMGMSDDFEVAIEEGATDIRLGRAIFGG